MTKLIDTPTRVLKNRHHELMAMNNYLLNSGQFEKYRKNCLRIANINGELYRRGERVDA